MQIPPLIESGSLKIMEQLHASISTSYKKINNSVSQSNIKIGRDLEDFSEFKYTRCSWFDNGGYCDCLYEKGFIDKNCAYAELRNEYDDFEFSDKLKASFYNRLLDLAIKRTFEVYRRLTIDDLQRALSIKKDKKATLSGKLSMLLTFGAIRKENDRFELIDVNKFKDRNSEFSKYYKEFSTESKSFVKERALTINSR
jgi:hypothetical protein